jgi:hypothetical protein
LSNPCSSGGKALTKSLPFTLRAVGDPKKQIDYSSNTVDTGTAVKTANSKVNRLGLKAQA